MHTNAKKIIKIMEHIAPGHLKEDWDNVGLMLGNPNKMIENVMVTLEVTEAVIDEAVEKNVDMIISHHPLIYKALKHITTDDPIGNMVLRLIRNDINLFVAHTNLDAAKEGTSKHIANLLSLEGVDYMEKVHYEQVYKLQVFVPETHAEEVKHAMTQAGAGSLGEYSECLYTTSGQGQFRPGQEANPAVGHLGELTLVDELKIEAIVTKDQLGTVVDKMIQAHPYETVAYDVIKLENRINEQGIGMYGYLNPTMSLEDLTYRVKQLLKCDTIRFIGPKNKKISRVAIITGSGGDYFKLAKKYGDVLITGDIKYHEAQGALQMNLMVIDAGHFETEQVYIQRLQEMLRLAFEEKSYDVKVILSETNINPFQTLVDF